MDIIRSVNEENSVNVEEGVTVSSRFFLLLLAGFVLVVVGVVVVFVVAVFSGSSSVSGGAIIFIGPFPIVIGAGPDVAWLVLFSVIFTVLGVVVFFVLRRKMRLFGD